jgi:hypothetical protein
MLQILVAYWPSYPGRYFHAMASIASSMRPTKDDVRSATGWVGYDPVADRALVHAGPA